MRLRRHPTDDDQTAAIFPHLVRLWRAFERAFELTRELTPQAFGDGLDDAQRARALAEARQLICEVNLFRHLLISEFAGRPILDVWVPHRFLDAAPRVAYALSAMAEPSPTPEALLTQPELDGLIEQHALHEWIEGMRNSEPVKLS